MVHVLTVGARVGKAFQTFGTLEWLFARVQALVLGQVMLVLKRSRALLALVRPLSWNRRAWTGKLAIAVKMLEKLVKK